MQKTFFFCSPLPLITHCMAGEPGAVLLLPSPASFPGSAGSKEHGAAEQELSDLCLNMSS